RDSGAGHRARRSLAGRSSVLGRRGPAKAVADLVLMAELSHGRCTGGQSLRGREAPGAGRSAQPSVTNNPAAPSTNTITPTAAVAARCGTRLVTRAAIGAAAAPPPMASRKPATAPSAGP